MPRASINLGESEGLAAVGGTWKVAQGYIPGEANDGLVAEGEGSPARLPDYDDSNWEVCQDLTARLSHGFTFIWYRINVTIPESAGGHTTSGVRVQFETCVDDYGEIWIDGECNRERGTVQGFNVPQRAVVSDSASPGDQHSIAVLAVNGPLGAPGGTVFMRYATLAFEWTT